MNDGLYSCLLFWVLFNQRYPDSWLSNGFFALIANLASQIGYLVVKEMVA